LSMINLHRSSELLCAVLRLLVKRSEISESEYEMVSTLFWKMHSALTIMRTIDAKEEQKRVDGAFEILKGIMNGKTMTGAPYKEETIQYFNRQFDLFSALLTETIRTAKNRE
ncbi:hypothetical protein PENTCL1PPCAC_17250, partial [Pristionchus entomophagus]